jgi:amino acid adenylation domain-containing protein
MTTAHRQEGIAIIGMAGRFPKARSITELWRNLREGVEAISFFEDAEIEDPAFDAWRGKPNYVKARGVLEDADKFDAAFFGINPKEAEIIDPQQRVFLECAWEALEDAGYDPDREERPIGVFAGLSMNTYLMANLASNAALREQVNSFQTTFANDKDYLSTRVSYKLNLRGPSMTVQTACSTSLVTVCIACQQLASYQCDVALAGGVSIMFPQKKGHLYQEGGISSADGHCRAFDARANGTVWGEGVGIVVLKRLADAIADGDHIYAVIKGFAINNDGGVKAGFTAPSEEGQAEVIALAQALANVEPESIQYVVTHGTGTPLGDPIEVAGLTRAFRMGTQANGFCALTSIKSNIGHLDVAAGIAALIEAVLALHHQQIPPTLHYEKPNPKINFANSPFFVNATLRPWPRGETPRRAGVSSFGIGGTNAHVVLEEAPGTSSLRPEAAKPQLLVLSARTNTALDTATTRLAARLRESPTLPLPDVACTLQLGRRTFAHRRCVVACTCDEAADLLSNGDSPGVFTGTANQHSPAITFMFPGQGSQQVNMGRGLYEAWPAYRCAVDECAESLWPHLQTDLRTILFPKADEVEQAGKLLQETRITQPALFVTSYALAKLWISLGVRAESMMGHSIGEYVSACLSGVMTLADALKVVAARGRLMQEMAPGSMLAVRESETELKPLLIRDLSIAAINGPNQCVVSGPAAAIDEFERVLNERKVMCQKLRTSHAFHSAMMEPMLQRFASVLQAVRLDAPKMPFISNVTGTWIEPSDAIEPDYWVRHLRQTVRFADGLRELLIKTDRVFLEVGPGQTLAGLVRQQAGAERTPLVSLGRNTGGDEDRGFLAAAGQLWLNGIVLDWNVLRGGAKRRRVPLPTYPFERKRYWVEPARQRPVQVESAIAVASGAAVPDVEVDVSRRATKRNGLTDRLRELFAKLSGLSVDQMKPGIRFVEMGFDSLFLTQASQAIQKTFGVQVPFGQLLERYSTLNLLTAHLQSQMPTPTAQPRPGAASERNCDRANNGPIVVPLTEAQREIWYATHRGDAASSVFNETFRVELDGELDADAFRRSVRALVRRHEALRLSISADGENQVISPFVEAQVADIDLRNVEPTQQEKQVQELLDAQSARPFDLSRAPLLRFHLVRLGATRHVLVVVSHHIVCDGASIGLIARELGALYGAECRHTAVELGPPCRFTEFAQQQAHDLTSARRAEAEKYWIARFATPLTDLELPQDTPRPAIQSFRAGQGHRRIGGELTEKLERLSAQQGATLFTTLLAAYYALLYRLTGQDDLVVGMPASGRGAGLDDKLVGHCVNFLPMRLTLKGDASFADHLALICRMVAEGYDHQSYTFGSLIQQLALRRSSNRGPLVSATFNLLKGRGTVSFDGLTAKLCGNHRSFTNFDLAFDVMEYDGELVIDCTYSADLFRPETIDRWLSHFETLLEGVVTVPATPVSQLPLLSAAERRQLLVDWNQTALKFPRDACLHELFEKQAERTPDAVAALVGGQAISYRELNQRANQLARYLQSRGVGPDVLVGLCVERSFALLVGTLGILKAGGAYVPVDWTYPPERVRFMIDDTQAPVLVAQQSLLPHVPQTRAHVVCLDADWEQIAAHATSNPEKSGRSQDLAYVMYTSGSTGLPKGVGLEHRSAVSFIFWAREVFPVDELKGVLASTSICFDLSVFEIFVPLSWGGTVVLAENAVDLPAPPPGREITLINTVPSAVKDLLKAGALPQSVTVVNLAGEKLTTQVVQHLYAQPHVKKVYDLYGPSEATTYATWALRTATGPATIGRPVANTQVYILDSHMQPCPIGVPGEIYIGGDCLARGYINRPDLTAEKFVSNPFSDVGRARLYKTGDLARYLPDGNIEFIGRRDGQIKIRGYRVELGEIESVLSQHSAVQECVAVAPQDASDQMQLVAYIVVVPGVSLSATEVRRFLREHLPDYMVPTVFVPVPSLPLLPNGKVNPAALPAPGAALTLLDEEEPPAAVTVVEQALIDIWREVIGVDKVGLHDDFFDLGGHSVLVTQVISRVRQVFEVEINMRHLFGAPTVAGLAQVIGQLLDEQLHALSPEEFQQLAAATAKEAS